MFLSKNKSNNVHPYKPQFYCIKVELRLGGGGGWGRGVMSKLYRHVFMMQEKTVSLYTHPVKSKAVLLQIISQ